MEHSIAGWIGGAIGIIVGHPLDTVKIRLQTQGVSGRTIRYTSPMHSFMDICKTEGVSIYYS